MESNSDLCVGYRLHKDNTAIVEMCKGKANQIILVKKLTEQGYNAIPMTVEEGNNFLNNESKKYVPKPLTAQERWENWALGK